jgi:hypothetical protein
MGADPKRAAAQAAPIDTGAAPRARPRRGAWLGWRVLVAPLAAAPSIAFAAPAQHEPALQPPQAQVERRPAASKAELQRLQPRAAHSAAKAQPPEAGDAAAVGGVLVTLREALDEPQARALLSSLGATPLRPFGLRGWLVHADAASADALAQSLQASPQVEHAHPNRWQRRALK